MAISCSQLRTKYDSTISHECLFTQEHSLPKAVGLPSNILQSMLNPGQAENRARLGWLASAVAVLPMGFQRWLGPMSHQPLVIWRMWDLFPVVQAPSAPCVHHLCLIHVISSSLRVVCGGVCDMYST
jgi:hypothetical protein